MSLNFLLLEKEFYSSKATRIYQSKGKIFYLNNCSKKLIDVLIVRLSYQLDAKFLKKFKSLKLIITPTTGLSHIDLEYCRLNSIKIYSLKHVEKKIKNVKSTAELSITLMLALNKQILKANNFTKKKLLFNRNLFISEDISGKTLGIVGLGRIGRAVAEIADSLGMKIIYYDEKKINSNLKYKRKPIKYLFKNADIISLHLNYNKLNINFINYELLSMCKKNCIIVNTSRGELIDENYLIKLIKTKKLRGYAADVIANENNPIYLNRFLRKISKLENIIITPHIGGFTKESLNYTEDLMADYFIKNFSYDKNNKS